MNLKAEERCVSVLLGPPHKIRFLHAVHLVADTCTWEREDWASLSLRNLQTLLTLGWPVSGQVNTAVLTTMLV
jgi:hypothetical protein